MISVNDPDARHTRKSPEARRDGYRAHVAACPETGIITDEKLTGASGTENSDPAVAEEFLAAGTGSPDVPAPAARLTVRSPAARASQMKARPQETAWPGTAIPPMEPGTCAARSMTWAMTR